MGTWNAFYVKAKHEAALSFFREEFPNADIAFARDFVGVRMPDDAFQAPETTLAEMSRRLNTEVIWLGFQSTVDAFQFHHWHDGELLRSLVFGCFGPEERTWERVEGKAETWERAAIFAPKSLEILLEYTPTDAERRDLLRIWREGELRPGRTEPNLDSRGCAHEVARFYGLPHYGYE
jgi:hypothetical protein